MSTYGARIRWERGEDDGFTRGRYGRAHEWRFDGGARVPASASPLHVRPPLSDPAGVDPEEAFVASLSSCHMLFFLYLAAQRGYAVTSYDDASVGAMTKGAHGREWMAQVTLRPRVVFDGERRPTLNDIDALHHEAHELCYIANSVKTEIIVKGSAEGAV